MNFTIIKEANNIWKKAASQATPERLNFEVELYKKLLNFFHIGDYYYAIFNYLIKDFDLVSKEVETMLGYSIDRYNVPFLLNCVHPEDIGYLLNFENTAMDFLTSLPLDKLTKYKIRHDFRVKRDNGEYIRLLQQGVVIEHDQKGGILRTLIIHTDITTFKTEGKPVLSFIGLDGEPSHIDIDVKKVCAVSKDALTRREKEILTLLIEGRPSKEIGCLLNISKQTVDNHRKNMLCKNNLKNTGELIGKAIKLGWL